MVLKFLSKFSSVNLRHIGVSVAWVAAGTRLFLDLVKKFWTLLLEELAIAVIVFERDAILLHQIVVGELG